MIKTKSGYELHFNFGGFDSYCVYIYSKDNGFYKPLDIDYLQWISDLADKYSKEQVYNDFLNIYNAVTDNFNEDECLIMCERVDENYIEDTTHWWCIFFMTMFAEMKKTNAILKKRIKHLGVYNVLFDKYDVNYVTHYMRGTDWRTLDKLMKERGI